MAITMPIWPAALPMPDRDSYQYTVGFGLLRTTMQGGSTRQRRTQWGMPGTFNLSWRMNTTQLAVFQMFCHQFAYGWFAMDLVTGAARVWRPKSDCMYHRIRFIADTNQTMIGPNLWRVTVLAEVEAMLDPRADTSTAGQFAKVDDVTPEKIDELSNFDTLSL